jgi:hypothetical protein
LDAAVPSSERLSTGRRHIRAGSVHVKELIGRQPRPLDLTGPFAFDADHPLEAGMLDRLLSPGNQPPSSHRRPSAKGAQLAKIAGLGVASCVLCASITFGSMITHRHHEDGAAPATGPTVDISGERALLPDLLNRAVPRADMTGKPELAGTPTNATGTINNPGPPPSPTGPPPSRPASGTDTAHTAHTDEQLSRTQLVERFFKLAPGSPDRAFSLLDDRLLGTDLDKFVRSWSDVRDVQVLDVREQGNDVRAVVRLRLPDGTCLRVQQLFDVADTVPRRIVGVQILSAQRT